MSDERFKPSVTVAAVIERDGRYLLVEEMTPEGLRLNNPAGHLEPGESLVQAVAREALEETTRPFTPEALVGVYLARFERVVNGTPTAITYLRFAICGQAGEPVPGRVLDVPVQRTVWLTLDEVRSSVAQHRSPLVRKCVDDHARGVRHSLALLNTEDSVYDFAKVER
jgi:ADP-ribose pyrophosphatase YjhB (NUDIX family)